MLFVLRMFRNHLFPGIHIDYTHNNDNIFGCFSTCNNNFDNRNNIGNSCPVTADNMHGQWFRAVIVLRRCELFRLYKRHVGSFSGQLYAMRVRYPCRNNTDHSYSRNNPYYYDTDTRIADYNIGMFGKHTAMQWNHAIHLQ